MKSRRVAGAGAGILIGCMRLNYMFWIPPAEAPSAGGDRVNVDFNQMQNRVRSRTLLSDRVCCHPAAGYRVFRRGEVVVPHVPTTLAVQLRHGDPCVLLRGVFKRGIKGHGRLCLGHVRATYVLYQVDGPSNWIFSPNQRNLHPVFLKRPEPSTVCSRPFSCCRHSCKGSPQPPRQLSEPNGVQRVFRSDRSRCHGWHSTLRARVVAHYGLYQSSAFHRSSIGAKEHATGSKRVKEGTDGSPPTQSEIIMSRCLGEEQ